MPRPDVWTVAYSPGECLQLIRRASDTGFAFMPAPIGLMPGGTVRSGKVTVTARMQGHTVRMNGRYGYTALSKGFLTQLIAILEPAEAGGTRISCSIDLVGALRVFFTVWIGVLGLLAALFLVLIVPAFFHVGAVHVPISVRLELLLLPIAPAAMALFGFGLLKLLQALGTGAEGDYLLACLKGALRPTNRPTAPG